MKKRLLLLIFVFTVLKSSAQVKGIEVYPQNWWTGMKTNSIQLLIRSTAEPLSDKTIEINYPGITVNKTHTFANSRYVAIDVTIAPETKPGKIAITLKGEGKSLQLPWSLEKQRPGKGTAYAKGISSEDVIYLMIPDRFSNGDPKNDRVAGMRDQSLNRDSMYLRHGGDIKGMLNHLNYFEELGVTSLWLLPVQENDRPDRTEHGYGITNHYKIDPRFGGEEAYLKLSDELHKRDMKLVMDAVYNHTDVNHILELDKPDNDWMHRWPTYTQTTYREQTLFDPYAAPSDKKRMTDGWFDRSMPDINHSNPFMAKYLIQNMIWYVQKFGIDAIRIDTYTYNDPEFSNACNKAITEEFPQITLFGESKVNGIVNQAYFNENVFDIPFKSNLHSAIDFQCLRSGISPALTEGIGWDKGVYRLYNTASSDFVNRNPMKNVLLLDNHDETRFFTVVNGDVEKQKMAYQWLLTYRGIPQMYYGSEVLLKGGIHPDGLVRSDFPGGWIGDKKNAFTGTGLTESERSVLDLVKKMGQFRKASSAIKTGKMMHYVPVDGLYVYFRYDDNQTVMCVMNTNNKPMQVDFSKYAERTSGFSTAVNILTNQSLPITTDTTIPPTSMWVMELKK